MRREAVADAGAASDFTALIALGRASAFYALGGLAYKGIALLAVPLLARLLSPQELGLLDLAAVVASIVGLSVALGGEQAVAYLEPRIERLGALWGSALSIVVTTSAAIVAVLLAFQGPLAQLLTGEASNGAVIAAAAVYGAVIAISAAAMNAVRLHGSPTAYAAASFGIVTAEMVAVLAAAALMRAPVSVLVLAWAVGAAIVAVPILVRHVPELARPQVSLIRRLVAYGVPLVPAAVVWLIGDAWIRATLARETELASLGLYGIAYRIASVLALAVAGFGVAWHPYVYRSAPEDVRPRASGALTYVILALSAIGVALSALAPELIGLVAGDRYAGAGDAVPALAGGLIASAIFVLVSAVVGSAGSTRRVAVAAGIGVVAQALVAGPLIGALSLEGAGLTSLVGYAVAAATLLLSEPSLVRGQRGISLGLAIALSAAGLALAAAMMDSPLGVRAALATLYGATVLGAGFVLRAWKAAPDA